MGYLTEIEIIDKLIDSLRIAAQSADDIAIRPKKGRTYRELRDALAEVEDACRQMAHWRGQYNWLIFGKAMAEAHRRAGGWLRGIPYDVATPEGGTVTRHKPIAMGEKHPLFIKLAENLRFCLEEAKKLRDKATGVIGAVLPEVQNPGRRAGAPVAVANLPPGMIRTGSGLIVPQGMASQ